ncbi:uncharacterized protein KY384_008557 [Bacidia gigantensis]|uniref:uncharacterized protein n=1 Tax=Bacidia gigantensis TaxID=2732470 RepID=UPI001D0570C4|nr:uncharacterized protein KY384_008557 [Bacidia gigantensis]KAG8527128.1 hypothetical protein KY384_008557 [Bacidia gigantensis]
MAVLSRPSRRSARKDADPESPATDKSRKAPESRRRKRLRNNTISHENDTSSKKLKFEPNLKVSKTLGQGRPAHKTLPIRDRQPYPAAFATHDGKSRKLDPVLVQPRFATTPTPLDPDEQPHKGINQNLPPPAADQVDKRSLRSHDGGSRTKSELAPYFNDYDELISIEPKDPDLLTPDTILHIYDDSPNSTAAKKAGSSLADQSKTQSIFHVNGLSAAPGVLHWPEETFSDLTNAKRIDFSVLDARTKRPLKDPLDESIFIRVHAREERKEKQLRNIEKERAMHEKFQLERLLDGLRGHDWLRVMGISGITDGEKKAYEPKRDHLIAEVRALLEKFRLWKEEEKRRKAAKDDAMEDDEDEEDEDIDSTQEEEDSEQEGNEIQDSQADSESISDGDPPDYSDVDASAVRQLHWKALDAAKSKASKRPQPQSPSQGTASKKPMKEKPFTSFYAKPYMRAAAIGGHRRSGRSRTAFGHPIPEVEERDFELPEDIMTAEATLESGRRMRRTKRDHKDHQGEG